MRGRGARTAPPPPPPPAPPGCTRLVTATWRLTWRPPIGAAAQRREYSRLRRQPPARPAASGGGER
eukprot:792847-Prorocentrum_minimum.AAC.2